MPFVSDLNGIVNQSIDQAISNVLSKQVMQAFYLHLRTRHSMDRDEIPYRLETFFSVLENEFGIAAAGTLSRAIARTLYSRLSLTFEDRPSYSLSNYVEEAKRRVETNPDP